MFLNFVFKIVRWLDYDGYEMDINVEDVLSGDKFCIRSGESILVDGIVIEGKIIVDELMVIGEFMLVIKMEGDFVIGGIIN